ncbi:hypothetical protein [Sphingomonas sp. Leaf4]|uniref:hypothetical protein n=1 Tax=Sphingomonas sp. Leaf4 TaxID=2876553 RepID=UPI001E2C3AC0|nr:hypothetical protein [Sphingomonas sp. Leaf4]
MGKLFLPARVPSEGARRLAAWLIASPPWRSKAAMGRIGCDPSKIARMIEGELVPSAAERYAISRATDFVFVRHWSLPAMGGWGDPMVHLSRRAA